MIRWRMVDGKVMTRGKDLIMAVKVEGTFIEVFELTDYPFDSQVLTPSHSFSRHLPPSSHLLLSDFPFDSQGLTCTLVFNCRSNGPMPMDIILETDCKVALTCMNLCPPIKE